MALAGYYYGEGKAAFVSACVGAVQKHKLAGLSEYSSHLLAVPPTLHTAVLCWLTTGGHDAQ